MVTIRIKDGEYTDRVDLPKEEPDNLRDGQEFRDHNDGLLVYEGVIPAVRGEVNDTVYRENANAKELIEK